MRVHYPTRFRKTPKGSNQIIPFTYKLLIMAGTRYGHKLKARLNKGKTHTFKEKGTIKTNYQIHSPDGYVSMSDLADLFFTTVEKIKKARRIGIIKEVEIEQSHPGPKVFYFERDAAIEILSKFKDKNGFLLI